MSLGWWFVAQMAEPGNSEFQKKNYWTDEKKVVKNRKRSDWLRIQGVLIGQKVGALWLIKNLMRFNWLKI